MLALNLALLTHRNFILNTLLFTCCVSNTSARVVFWSPGVAWGQGDILGLRPRASGLVVRLLSSLKVPVQIVQQQKIERCHCVNCQFYEHNRQKPS